VQVYEEFAMRDGAAWKISPKKISIGIGAYAHSDALPSTKVTVQVYEGAGGQCLPKEGCKCHEHGGML
jgi:hypothetical protein